MLASSSAEARDDFGSDSGDPVGRENPIRSPQHATAILTRTATAEDIKAYFGAPQRGTMRAIAVEMDGEVAAIVGVVREGPVGKYFTDISPELQPHLRSITILRAIKASMELVKQYRGPVLAIAESVEGCMTLNRLGFTHLDGAYYQWLK
jgi:hypothetical protein